MQTHALTLLTHQRRSLFTRTANADLMLEILFHQREQSRYQLHAFALMPDHIHILLTPSPDHTLSRCLQFIKGGFSHAIRKQFKGEVWHPGHHEHRIRDIEDFINQKNYIAKNPERRHLIDHPTSTPTIPAKPTPSHPT